VTAKRRAPLTRACPAPGCGTAIGMYTYACGHHWRGLPAGLRLDITRAFGRRKAGAPGAIAEHQAAMAAADTWLTEHTR
jgi:hypothetical protein